MEGNDEAHNGNGSDDPIPDAGRPPDPWEHDSIPGERPPHQSKV